MGIARSLVVHRRLILTAMRGTCAKSSARSHANRRSKESALESPDRQIHAAAKFGIGQVILNLTRELKEFGNPMLGFGDVRRGTGFAHQRPKLALTSRFWAAACHFGTGNAAGEHRPRPRRHPCCHDRFSSASRFPQRTAARRFPRAIDRYRCASAADADAPARRAGGSGGRLW